MERQGCPVSAQYVQCVPCAVPMGGAFELREDGSSGIVVCQNHVKSQEHAMRTLAHELLHAFDHCRAHVDFSNLHQHACTEIRAANLSTDCHFATEVERGNFSIKDHHNTCVRRRAILSVTANPFCPSPADAEKAVNAVWDICIADLEPFGAVP
jgi:inner membrane protease ATP23